MFSFCAYVLIFYLYKKKKKKKTTAHMAAVRRFHTLCFHDIFVDAKSDKDIKVVNDDGKRYGALLYIKI